MTVSKSVRSFRSAGSLAKRSDGSFPKEGGVRSVGHEDRSGTNSLVMEGHREGADQEPEVPDPKKQRDASAEWTEPPKRFGHDYLIKSGRDPYPWNCLMPWR